MNAKRSKANWRVGLLTCGVLLIAMCQARSTRDSLWTIWNDRAQPDTVRLKAIETLAWNVYLYSQPDSAFLIAGLGHELAVTIGDRKFEAKALNTQGAALYLKGDLSGALDHFQQCLSVDEALGDRSGIAAALANIGSIHFIMGDRARALDHYLRSLRMEEELGGRTGIAPTLNNVGLIYKELGDMQQALAYFTRSAKISEKRGDRKGVASAWSHMGDTQFEQGDKAVALELFKRSLAIRKELDDRSGIAKDLTSIGRCHMALGRYEDAMAQFVESLRISTALSDNYGLASTMRTMGQLHLLQGRQRAALRDCAEALHLAGKVGSIEIQRDACACLHEGHKALGEHDKALAAHERMVLLNDSLKVEETTELVRQMEFAERVRNDSLEQVERQRLVDEAHREEIRGKNMARNIAVASGILLLLVAGGLFQRYRFIQRSKATIEHERDRSDALLLNILPAKIAAELKEQGRAAAHEFGQVSILFTDFKDFTETSATLSAQELVGEIHSCFKAFDAIMDKFGIEKIKTIGDAYMAAGGVPEPCDSAALDTVLAALEMQAFIQQRYLERVKAGLPAFQMRIGIHTGPVVAGIVGTRKFQYDIWGDTVNTASRMESSGAVGEVNISAATYALVKVEPGLTFTPRGKVQAKGKGELEMYFVHRSSERA